MAPLSAQTTADFENFDLPVDTFRNGSNADGGFASGQLFLPNDYTAEFDSWTGWAISTMTDTLTRGFTNQYSAITGGGFSGSTTYAVNYNSAFVPAIIELTGPAAGGPVTGLYLTNSTYAYYSMLEGDSFAKRFGGETGDDPDFLRLTFRKYLDGMLSADSIDFYLADYRFADNSMDYIVDEWTFLDLSPLGNADSLQIMMTGTDLGQFGLNTPSYFCVDAVTTADAPVALQDISPAPAIRAFPNPTTNAIQLDLLGPDVREIRIYDQSGRIVGRTAPVDRIDLSYLPAGTYWLQIVDSQYRKAIQLIKN